MKYIISAALHAAWLAAAYFWAPAILLPVAGALAANVLADGGVL
jgi:hypothetical protein